MMRPGKQKHTVDEIHYKFNFFGRVTPILLRLAYFIVPLFVKLSFFILISVLLPYLNDIVSETYENQNQIFGIVRRIRDGQCSTY